MYDTIKDVINSGRYELNDMLHKIDTLWVQGDLDDDQRDELVELARENATPEQTYAPIQEQIDQAFAQIKALSARVEKLEAGKTPEPSPGPEEWQRESKKFHNSFYDWQRDQIARDARLDEKLTGMDDNIKKVLAKQEACELKPGKRWDAIVDKTIWAGRAAVIAVVLAKVVL